MSKDTKEHVLVYHQYILITLTGAILVAIMLSFFSSCPNHNAT